MPGRTFAWRTVNAFQTRCRPTDITSFITSYFDATESNTPATRCAFSDSSTCANPKCVAESRCLSFMPKGYAGRSGRPRSVVAAARAAAWT